MGASADTTRTPVKKDAFDGDRAPEKPGKDAFISARSAGVAATVVTSTMVTKPDDEDAFPPRSSATARRRRAAKVVPVAAAADDDVFPRIAAAVPPMRGMVTSTAKPGTHGEAGLGDLELDGVGVRVGEGVAEPVGVRDGVALALAPDAGGVDDGVGVGDGDAGTTATVPSA
jgi:hypothetical protein